jgi:hypothetical protein
LKKNENLKSIIEILPDSYDDANFKYFTDENMKLIFTSEGVDIQYKILEKLVGKKLN